MGSKIEKIVYFGVKINKTPRLLISRDNYAIINKSNTTTDADYMKRYPIEAILEIFEDESCKIYNDKWCEKQREKCLKNFDLNMQYMNNLSEDKFNKEVNKLLKLRKFIKIHDLNTCDKIEGIYILVLDKYKQIYIGMSNNIKRRIMTHWSRKMPFDRLIFGSVESSVLSIDSFGALDTTRIYIYPTYNTHNEEKYLESKINSNFLLNRTGGGIGRNSDYAFEIVLNAKQRKL